MKDIDIRPFPNVGNNKFYNINEGYYSNLDIELREKGHIIDFKFDNKKPTQKGNMGPENRWNPIIMYEGKPYRERIETLILKGDQIFLAFNSDKTNYNIPGGGTEKSETILTQGQHECNEEARIKIKNCRYICTFLKKYGSIPRYVERLPVKNRWVGHLTHVSIADYDSYFDGYIPEVDKDYKIYNNGKFYDINKVRKYLKPEHIFALMSDGIIKD